MRRKAAPHFNSPLRIALTFLLAFMCTIFPWPLWLSWLQPNWVLLLLVYWLLYTPYRLGIVTAWFIGVLYDLLTGSPLGVHALTFTLIAFGLLRFNTMLRGLTEGRKIALVGMIQSLDLALQYLVSVHYHVEAQTWRYWIPIVTTTAFWPLVVAWLSSKHEPLNVR